MHVLQLRAVLAWVVVRRLVRIRLKLRVRNWNPHFISEVLEVIQGQLLHLVGGVAALKALAKAVTLYCLCNDYCRLALVVHCCLIGGINLVVVVSTALEAPDLVIGQVCNHGAGSWVTRKEVVPDKATGLCLVGLVVPVWGFVHQVH